MRSSNYNPQPDTYGTPNYAAQRELGGRLAVLNGLIGNPYWQPMDGYDRNRIAHASNHGRHLRSRAFTGAMRKAFGLIRSLLEKHKQRYLLRQNIAELRSLNDRTLNDIGVCRGDIAALSMQVITVDELNQNRSKGGKPGVRLVSSKPDSQSESEAGSGQCTALVDHAA